jgi:hypothetical protein
MSDISNQLIKDSYNYVLQSDLSTGVVYRIGGGIPVNPKFLSGLTINTNFNYSNGTEQPGFVLITDASGNASWGPISGSSSGDYLPLSGGTVSGATNFTGGLTANTISATTYQNLPVPDLSNYVPYTGATQDVDLGTFSLSANNLTNNVTKYNTTYSITGNEPQGAVYWNVDRQTLQLRMNGTNYDYGMGLYFYIKNQSGVQINKGDVVGFAGTLGMSGIILGAKYVNDGSQPSDRLMGVAKENIPNGEEGKVVFFGEVRGINTNAFSAGTILYASNITDGALSSTVPNAGTNKGEIAAVVSQSSTVGNIFVRALTSKKLNEVDDVSIIGATNGQVLTYSESTQLWVPTTITFTGGTVTGATNFTGGLTANTISATTYFNLPNNVIKINPVTLTSGSWTLVGDYYQYTFTNVNIVSTGYVDFTPNNASNLEVTSCKLLPEITTNNGNCIFYSQFPPQNNIVGEMIINII